MADTVLQPFPSPPPFHGPAAHLVQFYEAEEFLHGVVADYLAEGIAAGEAAVVIATPEHREGFAAALRTRGFDPDSLVQMRRLTMLDARQTLNAFMAGGMPDRACFHAAMSAALAAASQGGIAGGVRAYGEMVDVLWRDGRPQAAIRLEELWNELAETRAFTLLCAYPMSNFDQESDAALFEHVCRAHGRVSPTERYGQTEGDARAMEISRLQQRAEALETEIERRKGLERELRDANRIKDEFLATLSHELRTPLTAILGWSHMLSAGGLDEGAAKQALITIEQSARTQARLVDDLLDVTKIVSGKLALQLTPVDLVGVIDAAVHTVELSAAARKISIARRGAGAPAVVSGDATRLQQVVCNLLSNAVKFTADGGVVEVSLLCDDGQASIIVHDEGCGIGADFLPHVFEPFRQADGSSTRSHGGLGIGLAIVRSLAELHGGTAHAASAGAGCGATFTVALPLGEAAAVRQS
jgi:signal transduction histidine kinase